jgi:hypothetical protein
MTLACAYEDGTIRFLGRRTRQYDRRACADDRETEEHCTSNSVCLPARYCLLPQHERRACRSATYCSEAATHYGDTTAYYSEATTHHGDTTAYYSEATTHHGDTTAYYSDAAAYFGEAATQCSDTASAVTPQL